MKIISFLLRAIVFLVLSGAVLVILFVRPPHDGSGAPGRGTQARREQAGGDAGAADREPEGGERGAGLQEAGGQAAASGEAGGQAGSAGGADSADSAAEATIGEEYYLTAEDITAMETLSLGDKLKGMAILSKLRTEVLNQIYTMARDGVTRNEAEDIECLLQANLEKDDIAAIKTILARK